MSESLPMSISTSIVLPPGIVEAQEGVGRDGPSRSMRTGTTVPLRTRSSSVAGDSTITWPRA